MAADAGGGPRQRLRLRRRRPPSEAGAPSSVPRPSSGRPWFLQETDNGNAEPWAELLRAVFPDVNLATESPPLSAFQPQELGGDSKHTAPVQVFTVGGKDFPWTPFPPAPKCTTCSYNLLRGSRGCLRSPVLSHFRPPEPETKPKSCLNPIAKEPPIVVEASSLACCPMCQMEFGTTLSQLDIDGHLAQCLAESTEDVAW